jgi:hypothetical protein
MCQICGGTRKIHEINNYAIRTSCCPTCGPIPTEEWLERQIARKAMVAEMRKKGAAAK